MTAPVNAKPPNCLRQLLAVAAAVALLGLIYQLAYLGHPSTPNAAESSSGWWNWWDQSKYLESAVALARGDWRSSEHWYPLGYALLAAPFVPLSPLNPFYAVNLVSFVALAFALSALAVRLGLGVLSGFASFVLGALAPADVFGQYVVPWNTTPVAALYVVALVLYIDAVRAGLTTVRAILFAVTLALVASIRPIDALALMPLVIHLALAAWRRSTQLSAKKRQRALLPVAYATATGLALFGLYALLHFAIYGAASTEYARTSARIGFDPGLIPIRYLLLFNSPRDIYGHGVGILEQYPALAAGMFGLVYTLMFSRHRAVSLVVLCSWAIYLAYVDFLPTGLWRFGNIHYLKWTFPVLAVLALYAAKDILRARDWRRVVLPLAVVAPLCLLAMRGESAGIVEAEQAADERELAFSTRPGGPYFAAVLDADGSFDSLYFPPHELTLDGRKLINTVDFKVVPMRGHARVVLHRPQAFDVARFSAVRDSTMRVRGPVQLIAPALGINNPFRCDTLVLFQLHFC